MSKAPQSVFSNDHFQREQGSIYLFFVNCPDGIIIFENLSLLFVAGFVIFDSLPSPPSTSPHWFQYYRFGPCAKIPPSQSLPDRGSDHPGNLLERGHKQRQRIDTEDMLALPELSGTLLGKVRPCLSYQGHS